MSLVRVANLSISVDGFGAGPDQSLQDPMGRGGMALHQWVFPTRSFARMHGDPNADGSTGVDNGLAERSFHNVGAWILGRHMFGPQRGPWPDDGWKGWWGDEPPYHVPVFVLTHHARAPLVMKGGTTFHFVTDGIESALAQARAAAGDKDVRIGGGMATIRQYLQAKAIDELHLAMSPVLMGQGEPLLAGLDLPALGYRCEQVVAGEGATHIVLRRA
jgi:dihydrofolate reductase